MTQPIISDIAAPRLGLYPPIAPYDTGMLKVDDIHTLYYEQSGNPEGAPVVFLHGGPGSGSGPKHRQYFDPKHYRIIVFDQRGAGKSTPLGELRGNTTENLVDDINTLRQHLKIERWHVFGGSWGSTLALAYAIRYPDQVASMTLRGIFMMRQSEVQWFLYSMKVIYPESWHRFAEYLPPEERGDILTAYYKRLTDPDKEVNRAAAKIWSAYEVDCLRLLPAKPEPPAPDAESHDYAIARIESHYFLNNTFKPDDYLLRNIDKIRHIPAIIVQGRYDVVCPPETAFDLHRAWPETRFIIVPDAGHSGSEPGIISELVTATNHFRRIKL